MTNINKDPVIWTPSLMAHKSAKVNAKKSKKERSLIAQKSVASKIAKYGMDYFKQIRSGKKPKPVDSFKGQ